MAHDLRAPLPRTLFLLNPEVVFLNHGSFGATPRVVFEKYQQWQRELEWQPVEFLSSTRRFSDLMREARKTLAAYLHTEADNLVYVPNATTAINIVARSLSFEPGDEVLTTNHEYGAMDRTWRFIAKKNGVGLRQQPLLHMQTRDSLLDAMMPVYRHQAIPLPVTTHADFVEQFWKGVNERTRVIFLSHITSPTALIFPVREICRRAREAGILTIIDGAHAVGQIPLDLEQIGADFVTSNLHKWALAPKGAAFLYARPERQHLIEPLIVSWGYESERPGPSRFIDEQEWTGTRDYSAYLAVPAALQFMEEHDWEHVRQYCHDLVQEARQRITALTELPPLSPDSTEWYMQMVTVPLPPCDPVQLKARLYDEFAIEVPIVTWQEKPFIRISIQAYNTPNDIDRLVNALSQLLCR